MIELSLRFTALAAICAAASACDPGAPIEEPGGGVGEHALGEALAPDEAPEDFAGEPCEAMRLARECGAEVGGGLVAGVQYCARNLTDDSDNASRFAWGECLTSVECEPVGRQTCDGATESYCELGADGVPVLAQCWDDIDEGDTPLVLSFTDAPVAFAPMPATAAFDIAGAGQCDSHDWPTAATPWLAIDLDGNGTIDSGRELFGSGTELADGGRASNGFVALAELDENGDGVVSEADSRWSELTLWADYDGDKRTDAGELEPLSAYGVSTLPLAYASRKACDDRRNCAIEQAAFTFDAAGSRRSGRIVDVHLPCR